MNHQKYIRNSFFPVIIDEIIDVSTCKQFTIIEGLWWWNSNCIVQLIWACWISSYIYIYIGDAETLFEALSNTFEKELLPLSNIIGFAADDMIFGQHSITSKGNNSTYFMKCSCHSALCFTCLWKAKTTENLYYIKYKTTFAIVQNGSQAMNLYVLTKHTSCLYILVFQGWLSNGMLCCTTFKWLQRGITWL